MGPEGDEEMNNKEKKEKIKMEYERERKQQIKKRWDNHDNYEEE